MAATVSPRRIDVLAKPKAFHAVFLEDRRSVYWVDRCPPQPGKDGTTVLAMTPRLSELCQPRGVHPCYIGHRPSPMWAVSEDAQQASASERLQALADFRPVHRDYMYERSAFTQVSRAAQQADTSEHLTQLSQPKPHKIWANSEDTICEGAFGQPITPVSPSARGARCSGRLEALADTKQPHRDYVGERPVMWPVSGSARNASASTRLQQLARPKSRGTINDDYDFYKVSLGARKTRPSPRMCDLALPIPRKVRQKKVG